MGFCILICVFTILCFVQEWGGFCSVECESVNTSEKAVLKAVSFEGETSTNKRIEATSDRVITARKGLTYPDSQLSDDEDLSVSPLQSYILHQKDAIKDQEKTLHSIEKDRDDFVRVCKQRVSSTLPTCSKCHLKEGHNRLNCPYPKPCSSSIYCKNVDKHPEDKQTLKDLNKKLCEERKCLSSMKEDLKNKEKSCESVKNRYVTRVKQMLMASYPEKYTIEIDGRSIENWRMINKDSKILEQEFRGKIPSPEEARKAIMSIESLVPHKAKGKTSVHKLYKQLWESQGVSWPKPRKKSLKTGCTVTSATSKQICDTALCSPQRKKPALASSSYIYKDDYELALGTQNSFDTLPDSFDLDPFEHTNNVEDFENKCVDEDETQPPLFDEVNSIFKISNSLHHQQLTWKTSVKHLNVRGPILWAPKATSTRRLQKQLHSIDKTQTQLQIPTVKHPHHK